MSSMAVLAHRGSPDPAAGIPENTVEAFARAARLGADVPFCVLGGRARVGGVGEILEPLDYAAVAGRAFTLLIPPFAVSTIAGCRRTRASAISA